LSDDFNFGSSQFNVTHYLHESQIELINVLKDSSLYRKLVYDMKYRSYKDLQLLFGTFFM